MTSKFTRERERLVKLLYSMIKVLGTRLVLPFVLVKIKKEEEEKKDR